MNDKLKTTVKYCLMTVLCICLCLIGKNAVEEGTPYKKYEFEQLRGADFGNPQGIDINECNKESLMDFHGIGEVYAGNMLSAREEMGGFKSIDDLLYAEGIGPKRLDAMRNSIKIR